MEFQMRRSGGEVGRWGGGGGWLLKDIRLKWSDLTFSLVCILESTFIPTPIIYLRMFRVPRRLLSLDNAWQT